MQNQAHHHPKKPEWIYFLFVIFLLLPSFTLLQLYLAGHAFSTIIKSYIFLIDWLSCWMAALAIYHLSRTSVKFFCILASVMLVTKFCESFYEGMEPGIGYWLAVIWVLAVTMLRLTLIRTPYLYPDSKWWKISRSSGHVMLGVLFYQGVKFPIITLQIFRTGVFIKLDERLMSEMTFPENAVIASERRRKKIERNPLMDEHELKMARARLATYPDEIGQSAILQLIPSSEVTLEKDRGTMTFKSQVAWSDDIESPYHFSLGLELLFQSQKEETNWRSYLKKLKKS